MLLGLGLGLGSLGLISLGHLLDFGLDTIELFLGLIHKGLDFPEAPDGRCFLLSQRLELLHVPTDFEVTSLGAFDSLNLLVDSIAANAGKRKAALVLSRLFGMVIVEGNLVAVVALAAETFTLSKVNVRILDVGL